jgi:hypothetical protein
MPRLPNLNWKSPQPALVELPVKINQNSLQLIVVVVVVVVVVVPVKNQFVPLFGTNYSPGSLMYHVTRC